MKFSLMGKNMNYLKCISSMNIFAYSFLYVNQNHHMKKMHLLSFFLFLPFLFLVLSFLDLTDSDYSLFNPLESVEPLLSVNKSVVVHVLKGSCPEKQCMDLFQLRK